MYLWIDLWDKRCGISVFIEGVIIPKDIVLRAKLISYIKKILSEYNIQSIIIGLPYDLYGKNLKQLEKTQKFIEKLRNIFPEIQIEWHDERFSSFEAENILSDMWIKEKEWQKDAIAAAIILESYLKQHNII